MERSFPVPGKEQNMKKRCAGLAFVLVSLSAFGVAKADIEFNGVLDAGVTVTVIDSVTLRSPDTTFLTLGWDSWSQRVDTFTFTGVTAWPETAALHGSINGIPTHKRIPHPDTSTWYRLCLGEVVSQVKFHGTGYGAVEEPKPAVPSLPRLTVSPSVVTRQMTVRLQPAGTSRQVVEIHDVTGNVVRSLDCTAGTDGVATAKWNREDESGHPVAKGVYFCRYAEADVVAVRKVLVAH
jgi:hypothetical protein